MPYFKNTKIKILISISFKILVIILFINLLFYLTNSYIYENQPKAIFRIIGSMIYIIVFLIFIIIKKPTTTMLGLNLKNETKKNKLLYFIGLLAVIFFIASSYLLNQNNIFNIIMILRFAIIATLFEEIIFRGYIWYKLEKFKFNNLQIILITGIYFGLFHLSGYYEIKYATSFFTTAPHLSNILISKVLINTLYGFILGFCRLKTKKIYLPMIIHSIGNIIRR